MNKINNLTKVAILAIYAILLFVLSYFIISGANKSVKRFTAYSETPYNDDITINAQVIETRRSKEESADKYEYSKFDVYLYLTKKVQSEITNLYSYVCSESDHRYSYIQTSTSKSMKESSYTSSTTSFLNSSTAFAYIQVNTDENGKVKSVDNLIPETIYIKVAYDITYPDDETTYKHELNYKFDVKKINFKDFNKYEKRSIGSTYIDNADDPFKIKIYKTITTSDDSKVTFENYKLSILEVDADNMAENQVIDSIDLTIYGKISNEEMLTDKNFEKYVRFFTYSGSLNRGVRTIRTATINKNYAIDRLYVTAVVTISDIQTHKTSTVKVNYYVDSADLLNS